MPEYKNHADFNRTLLSNPSKVVGREMRLKSVSVDEGIISQSSSYKTSESAIRSYNEGEASESHLISIDSCMKTITADACRRMVAGHPEYFPSGLDTPANHFLPQLRARFPDSSYVMGTDEQSAQQELTGSITFRDLLNNTSGLGNQTSKDFDERIKSNPDHKLKEGELLELDRKKGTYGEKEYSNQGYELLGMILCGVEQEIQGRSVDNPVRFSEVINRYVLSSKGLDGKIFTSDQMEVKSGEVLVRGRPEMMVTSGKYYHEGKIYDSRSFNYDQFGAGGGYASTASMVQYMESFTYEELRELIDANPTTRPETGKVLLLDSMGFNLMLLIEETGDIYTNFGGKGYGANSGALGIYHPNGKKSLAFTAMNTEDLTYPLAVDVLYGRVSECPKMNEEIDNKVRELKAQHSEEELLQMRKSFEARLHMEQVAEVSPGAQESVNVLVGAANKALDVTIIEKASGREIQ